MSALRQSICSQNPPRTTDERLPAILGGLPVRPAGAPSWPNSDPEILQAVQESVRSGNWGRYHGEATAKLIERLRQFFLAEHVTLCSSGTAGIELALRGLNIGAGDEVILAGYDFRGNFLNVIAVGATPVLVDLDPRTGQLDPQRVSEAFTDRTRAVIATHLHGALVDMPALRAQTASRNVAIIEDACQMPGAPWETVRAGMGGDVGVISFGGSKLLSAGRGGAILTNRADVVARIRRFAFRGNDAYPLSELQAAVLIPQLEKLDSLRSIRRNSVRELAGRLADEPGLKLLDPRSASPDSTLEPDYYKVGFRYHAEAFDGLSRASFVAAMRAEGIAFSPGFRALHRLHARSRFRQADELTESDRADASWLVLHHPVLLEDAEALDEIQLAVSKLREHRELLKEKNHVLAEDFVSPWETEA